MTQTTAMFMIPDRVSLLKALDLDTPDLAPVKAALEAGDVDEATHAFLAHFRTKTIASPLLPDWSSLPRDPHYHDEHAERILHGSLDDGYNVYEAPETGIDWHECPLACLTRFAIFPALLTAAHHTGDSRYLRFVVDHSLEYMREWPIETFIGHNTHEGWRHHYVVAAPWYWCMLPNRLDEWASAVMLLRACPQVTDDELLAILHRMVEETRFLVPQMKKHVDANHNSGNFMIRVLGKLCAVLSDFRETAQWRSDSAELFAQFVDSAFYPDGLYKELTMGYAASVINQTEVTACAFRNEPALAPVTDHLRAMLTALAGLTKPTGNLPAFGDHHPGPIGNYICEPFAERFGLPWVKSLLGQSAPLPPFTNWPPAGQDAWGGYYAMRSGWGPRENYLCIDGGPWGTCHQHCDRLSFDLTALGADFIVDPGCTKYASNEPDALLSCMYAGFLHNAITVDGVDEFISDPPHLAAKEPLQNRWEQGERSTLFEGTFDFNPIKPVRWTRRVLFADGAYWLLQDVLTGEQNTARIEQNFQFHEDITITLDGNITVATAQNGARLLVIPLDSGLTPTVTIADREPKVSYSSQYCANTEPSEFPLGRGWVARFTKAPVPAPSVTYAGETALPAAITLALVPLPAGKMLTDLPRITRETHGGTTVWQLPIAGGTLTWETSPAGCRVVG